MRKQIAAALLASCPLFAVAADWYRFNETGERTDLLDRSTLIRKGQHVTSWSKVSFRTPQVYRGGEADGVRYRSAMQFADFDCSKRTIYIVAVNYFAEDDADGSVIHVEKPVPGERPFFTPIAPDSVAEVWMKHACARTKRNSRSSLQAPNR